MERPFGLPPDITFEEYLEHPICTLSPYNYKVEASVGVIADKLQKSLCVFDTGAGPNLIRADLLPDDVIHRLNTTRKVVNLRSASTHQISVLGITHLTVEVNGYRCRQPFVVVRQLTSDVIIGTTFIDEHVENIWVRQRKVILLDGTEIPIQRRSALGKPTCLRTTEKTTLDNFSVPEKVYVAQQIILPARSETVVLATIVKPGLYVLEPGHKLYDRHKVSLTNGVIETHRPDQPVKLKVANFGNSPKRLHKRQILGFATPAPRVVHEVTFSSTTPPVVNEVELNPSCSVGTPLQGPTLQHLLECPLKPLKGIPPNGFEYPVGYGQPMCMCEALHTVDTITSGNNPKDSEDNHLRDLDISHLTTEQQKTVREALTPYTKLWSGHLGLIEKAKHRINLIPGAQPFRLPPYRSGPKAREIEQNEVARMLDEGVIEPSESEFASPVLLVPKPDGTKRFCVDYRRLNALTVKDSYPLQRMDECLDSLGNAEWFTTLDANSGYWQMAIPEEDRHKTAFVCHSGCYQFRRMPFGLCNAPATFQRTMDILLSQYKWQTCLVYLDDIIVYSNSFDKHVKDITDILSVLQQSGVSLKLKSVTSSRSLLTTWVTKFTQGNICCQQDNRRGEEFHRATNADTAKVVPRPLQRLQTLRAKLCTSCSSSQQ